MVVGERLAHGSAARRHDLRARQGLRPGYFQEHGHVHADVFRRRRGRECHKEFLMETKLLLVNRCGKGAHLLLSLMLALAGGNVARAQDSGKSSSGTTAPTATPATSTAPVPSTDSTGHHPEPNPKL